MKIWKALRLGSSFLKVLSGFRMVPSFKVLGGVWSGKWIVDSSRFSPKNGRVQRPPHEDLEGVLSGRRFPEDSSLRMLLSLKRPA